MLIAIVLLFAAAVDDRPVRKTLDRVQNIQGFECAAGYAWFHGNGHLVSCSVAVESTFGEARVPPGSRIHLRADGELHFVFLSRSTRIGSLTCRGHGHDYMTVFYPNGKLKLCWLAADQEVGGVPCRKAGFFADVFGGGVGTHFHANGALAQCKLSRDCTLQGQQFRAGDHVRFDEGGKLKTSPKL